MSTPSLDAAVTRWHEAVNAGDLSLARAAVSDPLVVTGPRSVAAITPDDFAQWIVASGIELSPTTRHPISERAVVVEQRARWHDSPETAEVATFFRCTGDQVSAVLRFPSLEDALTFAATYTHLLATE